MKLKKKFRYIIFFLAWGILSCIDPYSPPIDKASTYYLVVDGFINSTENFASVSLSRASNINQEGIEYETGADVNIEDDSNNSIQLAESINGKYSVQNNFSPEKIYRLKIQTKGETYYSDFIELKSNGVIDSLHWKIQDDAFSVFVNSHDPSSATVYYKFSIEETYEYTSPLFSYYRYENGEAVFRLPDDDIYHCWITTSLHSNILLASTENLNQNIISQFKLNSINRGDKRLWIKYSLLVRQHALSKSAYDYWRQVRKLSDDVGGINDPIPYSIQGNIRSQSDPNDKVIGFFYGGEVAEARIVVDNNNLPNDFTGVEESTCAEDYIPLANLSSLEGKDVVITIPRYQLTTIIGYYYTMPPCADCRLQGGTTNKPDFMN